MSYNVRYLTSVLDNLIEFRQSQNGSEPPRIEGWNPIARHRQHKELEEWVKSRPPSAGITAEQLGKRYPENLKEKSDIRKGAAWGGGIGAGVTGAAGATLGALGSFHHELPKSIHGKSRLFAGIGGGLLGAAAGGAVGTAVGAEIGGHKHFDKRMRDFDKAHDKLIKVMTGDKAVPVGSLKTDLPTASTYGEVNRELKKQDVGFIPRHATALLTRPMVWSGENAGFVTRGEKGLIVTSPKVHPAVFRHEAGHGKDYAHYGGEQGFKKAYPHYGLPVGIAKREDVISSTMLPEHRAWAYAKPRNKHEKDLRDAALTTYRSGLGLSALLDDLIQFKEKEKVPSKNAIQARQGLMTTGALAGGYFGGLISAEHGGAASMITGAKESIGKFTNYAREDAAREARKDAERYHTIEDRFGGVKKLLRGKDPGIDTEGLKSRIGSAAHGIGRVAKELPTRAKYATQDALYGAGKWLTRSSLSRGIATGAILGGLAGRYAGTKVGESLDKASEKRQRELQESKVRRHAKELAKAQVMAREIAEKIHSQPQKLSSKLDSIINFESITYHETEADRHLRKAKIHKEKAEGAFALGGIATTAGTGIATSRIIKDSGVSAIRKAGNAIIGSGKAVNVGGFIARHPHAIFTGAAFAPAAAIGTYYAGHKIGQVRQIGKANEQYQKANEARKKRNALAQSKNHNFDYQSDVGQLQEHAKKEVTKSAAELVYEKLLKGEKPRVRLSAKLDDLINFQDPRPRSPLGEFQPQGEGGPDPNAMATVYKMPQPQSGVTAGGVAKAGGAVFGAGALGAVGAKAGQAGWRQGAKLVKHLASQRKSRIHIK